MKWLTDAEIQSFFETAVLRVSVTQVHRYNVEEAWVVLTEDEDRLYIGTITRNGDNWTAFIRAGASSYTVGSFTTALQLIELDFDARWKETPYGTRVFQRVYKKVDES